MACPYFYPVEKVEDKSGFRFLRLPLGDPYKGFCRVDPISYRRPDENHVRDFCNLGYVRHRCPYFPEESGPDADRFSISLDRNGLIQIWYVVEKNHTAFEHGRLEYSRDTNSFTAGHSNELVQKQADAYLQSYLRRKGQIK